MNKTGKGGSSGLMESCGSKFLVFSFDFIYSRIKYREMSNLETLMGTDKNSSNKGLLSLGKGLGKRQLRWTRVALL